MTPNYSPSMQAKKRKIVDLMVVAIHCQDRTYGELADEIIAVFENEDYQEQRNKEGR